GKSVNGTNESGFSALPGGYRDVDGTFFNIGSFGYWWSATENYAYNAWSRNMTYDISNVYRLNYYKEVGFSVRCVRDSIKDDDVTTTEVTAVTQTSATSGGKISSEGGAIVSNRGVCWSTKHAPTIADNKTSDGTGVGGFTTAISGLTPNTTYYVRAYATNSAGTEYGSEMSFTTLEANVFNPNITSGSMTDIDGNTYKTVTIGTQTWMAENLKVTKYNNGTNIPNVTDATAWSSLTTGAYCNYNNDRSNVATYGRLYNWYAVNTGKLAPTGWHVPTDAEWATLTTYLGGGSVAGGKLKETGTTHWASPNTGATNETGFTALPGGNRDYHGAFYGIGYYGSWWSASERGTYTAWYRNMLYFDSNVGRSNYDKEVGFSVRCVRD
ncbi:MAG TPA: FISUMP domain-containing protein, partial [Paludibacteraceae bacterium]|nr:FISUMP domain-containing protein [Paludibacteraceae bacterium]HPK21139.1 FISUMP domain-containing protein [Paludibacteraceae bacterium]